MKKTTIIALSMALAFALMATVALAWVLVPRLQHGTRVWSPCRSQPDRRAICSDPGFEGGLSERD